MSERKDGGSAFPGMEHFGQEGGCGYTDCSSYGMSLRDWFAGHAIPAAMTVCDVQECNKRGYNWEKYIAIECYAIADAMIEARGK